MLVRLYKALVRSRIEYGAIIFYPLNNSLKSRLERIQNKAIRLALGLRNSTPTNVTLAEAKVPPIELRVKFLSRNYITKACTNSKHLSLTIVEKFHEKCEHPLTILKNPMPLLVKSFSEIEAKKHLIAEADRPLCYDYSFESMLFKAHVSFTGGEEFLKARNCNEEFERVFYWDLSEQECFLRTGLKWITVNL